MAQQSFFYGGTAGDASLSPYSSAEYAEAMSDIYGGDFVIGDYLNNLHLESSGAGDASVVLSSGGALCKGIVFESDADVSITLDAQAGGINRIDRIVLRYDSAAQTVRPTVIKGTAAAVPTVPALTANDMALWYVYVPDGFGAASTVASDVVHDERVINVPSPLSTRFSVKNVMPNSEFMAYAQGHGVAAAPDGWVATGVVPVCQSIAAFGSVKRGRAVSVELQAGDTLETWIPIPYADPNDSDSGWVTIKGLVGITTNTVKLEVSQYSVALGADLLAERTFTRTGSEHEYVIRVPTNVASYDQLLLSWSTAAGCAFTFGQIIVTAGFTPGPFRVKHETIMFDSLLTDANWSATAKGSGTTTISLNADFNANILRDTRGLLLRLIFATGTNGAYLRSLNKVAPATCISGGPYSPGASGTLEDIAQVAITGDINRQFRLVVDVAGGANIASTANIVGIYV